MLMARHWLFILFFSPCLLLSQNSEEKTTYGKIKVDKKDLKIYSQAYIHYPQVFRDFDRKVKFDTTSFEERFIDTTYANTVKIDSDYRDPRVYETVALDIREGLRDEIWFVFKKNEGYASLLTRKNPEVNSFTGMAWVYKGDLTRKEFEEKFIFYKKKSFLKRKTRKQWTDFRIYYNNFSQSFTIQLKNINGFLDIEAYPRYTSLTRDIKDSQERYEKNNAKYLKYLQRRKIKFDKKMTKRKNIFYNSIKEYDANLWRSFQKNYMTEEERKLPREEWLKYYDKVIANERKAMGNASPTLGNIVRSIKIDDYKILTSASFLSPNDTTVIKTLYQSKKEEKLAITNILIIDVEAKTYKKYVGSKGIKVIKIDDPENTNNVMVVWLRNGNIGFLSQSELRNLKVNKNGQSLITLNIINKKFASVQTLRNQLNF
ncbi:MAG: hypothetical protein JKY30_10620 [Flavobacteriales bacterium]|nr:hypothetical protein [Flavobacteriales bacterium]